MLFHFFFFFNDTATTEIYTLSLHDALPIFRMDPSAARSERRELRRRNARAHLPAPLERARRRRRVAPRGLSRRARSEEHTSELQSRSDLVCRLLLEKKKKITTLTQPLDYTS